MYGLPKDFSGEFLIGHSLEQICFNQNQVSLHFDGDIGITIEGSFSHLRSDSDLGEQVFDVPVSQSDLMLLLGSSISEAGGGKDGTLNLKFENGHTLRCFDKSREFESYQIRHGKDVIIV